MSTSEFCIYKYEVTNLYFCCFRLQNDGQISKAAAIALFNLKFGQTIEILSGKSRKPTDGMMCYIDYP